MRNLEGKQYHHGIVYVQSKNLPSKSALKVVVVGEFRYIIVPEHIVLTDSLYQSLLLFLNAACSATKAFSKAFF